MSPEQKSSNGGLKRVQKDILPSIVVFLVALPLCMGIAIASGVPVAAGLVTGIVGGLVVGLLGGSPLQVSGPAAGLTVIVYDLVQRHGLESLGVIVLMAGIIQFVAGIFKLGQWFRAVSPSVIKGMLAGIGILIFASQFHVMVDDDPKGSGIQNLVTIPQAIEKGLPWPKFGTHEEREARTEKLRQFGTLHTRQVEIREEVGEVVPEMADGELTEAEKNQLAALAERQEEVNAKLKELLGQLDTKAAMKNQGSADQLDERAEEALAATSAALADLDAANASDVRKSQARADEAIFTIEKSLKNHGMAAKIGLLTILVIVLWQIATPKSWRVIPAPLVAIVIATVVTGIFVLPVLYVEVPERLIDDLHVFNLKVLLEGDWTALLQGAIVIAVVASAETLLCTTATDQMHQGKRANYNRELAAQGVGNTVCGFLGALPMTGVIVRSSANVQAGAKTRWSAVMHGIWLLVFVVLLTALIRMIPVSALAAMLVYTGYKLVDIKSIRTLAEYGKGEVFIYFVTVTMIVATDLLTGVITGFVLASVKLLFTVSRLSVDIEENGGEQDIVIQLHGTATFLQLPILAEKLENVPRRKRVHIGEENLLFIDHACIELITAWSKQYQSSGGEVVVDLDQLHVKYRQPVTGNNGNGNGGNGNGNGKDHDGPRTRPAESPESVQAS